MSGASTEGQGREQELLACALRLAGCLPGGAVAQYAAGPGPAAAVPASVRQDYAQLYKVLLRSVAAWADHQRSGPSAGACGLPPTFLGTLHDVMAAVCGVLGLEHYINGAGALLEHGLQASGCGAAVETRRGGLLACLIALASLPAAALSGAPLVVREALHGVLVRVTTLQVHGGACRGCGKLLLQYACLACGACGHAVLTCCCVNSAECVALLAFFLDTAGRGKFVPTACLHGYSA